MPFAMVRLWCSMTDSPVPANLIRPNVPPLMTADSHIQSIGQTISTLPISRTYLRTAHT